MTLTASVFTSGDKMAYSDGLFNKNAGGNGWNAYVMTDTRTLSTGAAIEATNISRDGIIFGFGDGGTNIGNAQFKLGMRVEAFGTSGQMDIIVDGNIVSGSSATGVATTDVWKITYESDGYHFKKNGTDFANSSYSFSGDVVTAGNAYSEFTSQVDIKDSAGAGPSSGTVLLPPPYSEIVF